MLKFFLLATGDGRADTVALEKDFDSAAEEYLPHGYREVINEIGGMPLFEATERTIMFFGIGKPWNVACLNAFQDAVLNHVSTGSGSAPSFIEWWETSGKRKTVAMPANLDAIRILTIHKSKGLEFKAVIVPFISWNLDHIAGKAPVIWVKPQTMPFGKIGIAPVKYSKALEETIFAGDYISEKYSAYLDNLNLLYVAFTRAREALCGFSEKTPRTDASVSSLLLKAVTCEDTPAGAGELDLSRLYNPEAGILEYGTIARQPEAPTKEANTIPATYSVTANTFAMKLRFEGEDYFSEKASARSEKINYGKIMHEVFAGIDTASDVDAVLKKLSLEGKVPESQTGAMAEKINALISSPETGEWFQPSATVLREAGILVPSGTVRRPDRVIIKDGKATVIDFKFGMPNSSHSRQLARYRELVSEMGYTDVQAKIWYVDRNTVTTL
jgi:ATP-dependent exoDNAse (exonuclease V) beta subunit